MDATPLSGPRVRAERENTADRGGGRIESSAGVVRVCGPIHTRELGRLDAIASIVLLDAKGRRAMLHFANASWLLEAEEENGLEPFLRDLASRTGRMGVIIEPPPFSVRVRQEVSPRERGQLVWVAVGALGALLLLVGALLARDANREQELAEQAAAQEVARLAAIEQREHEVQARIQAQADTLAVAMQQAIAEERWRDAQEQHAKLKALRADDPRLSAAWSKLQPELARLDEAERQEDVREGLRGARAALVDAGRCGDPGHLSVTWRRLQRCTPNDPEWKTAVELAGKLDRCRPAAARTLRERVIEAEHLQGRGEANDPDAAVAALLKSFGLDRPLVLGE